MEDVIVFIAFMIIIFLSTVVGAFVIGIPMFSYLEQSYIEQYKHALLNNTIGVYDPSRYYFIFWNGTYKSVWDTQNYTITINGRNMPLSIFLTLSLKQKYTTVEELESPPKYADCPLCYNFILILKNGMIIDQRSYTVYFNENIYKKPSLLSFIKTKWIYMATYFIITLGLVFLVGYITEDNKDEKKSIYLVGLFAIFFALVLALLIGYYLTPGIGWDKEAIVSLVRSTIGG